MCQVNIQPGFTSYCVQLWSFFSSLLLLCINSKKLIQGEELSIPKNTLLCVQVINGDLLTKGNKSYINKWQPAWKGTQLSKLIGKNHW